MSRGTIWLMEQISRRRFLTRASRVAFGALVALLGRSPQDVEAYHTGQCNDYNCIGCLRPGCCTLGYNRYCTSTEKRECFQCIPSHPNWWMWTCCSGTTLYECYECCAKKCSAYSAYPNCCSSSGSTITVLC